MRISPLSRLLLLATLASAPLGLAQSTTQIVSGTYLVTFNLTLATTLPPGTPIVCKVALSPVLQAPNPAAPPVETAASLAVLTGSTATCTVQIPFAWTLPGPSSSTTLNFEIDALSPSGVIPVLFRSSTRRGIRQPYPPTGATAAILFQLTF